MNKLLLPINPVHINNIYSGVKKYEFRKIKCKQDIDTIVIYATSPIKKVVAEVEVLEVIKNPPEAIWEVARKNAGIRKEFFNTYFEGRDVAIAFKLGKVKKYNRPKKLSELGITHAPQSFIYLKENKDE